MSSDGVITLEVGVKAFIKNANGDFLFLKRAEPYHGQKIHKWDIPGGRINPREPLFKALKREIKEETGLQLKKIEQIIAVQDILRIPNKHTVRITYIATCKDGKVKIDPNEHMQFNWFPLEKLQRLRYDKYLIPVVKLLSEIKTHPL